MDERFRVNDPLRTIPSGITPEMPAVSLAWRALRAEHQRRLEERRREQTEEERRRRAFVAIANEVHRLRRLGGSPPCDSAEPMTAGSADPLQIIADRVSQALAALDIAILSPKGEVFAGELLELLDNVAQRPEPGIDVPRVDEVLLPAVTQRGALLQMGKVVIAVPQPITGGSETET